MLQWFCEVSSEIAGTFLQRWPTLEKLQKARPETLRKFFVQYSAQSEAFSTGVIRRCGFSIRTCGFYIRIFEIRVSDSFAQPITGKNLNATSNC